MDAVHETDKLGAVCYRTSPKIHTGYVGGMIGNVEGFNLNSTIEYADPKVYLDGRFYARGRWQAERDYIQYQGGPDEEGCIILPYHAAEVNVIVKSEDPQALQVFVEQDDRSLPRESGGEDITFDEHGKSILEVTDPRMYNLVKNREFGQHTLRLTTRSNAFTVYAFSFVSCVIPEVVLTGRG
jgi:hypothetical protein